MLDCVFGRLIILMYCDLTYYHRHIPIKIEKHPLPLIWITESVIEIHGYMYNSFWITLQNHDQIQSLNQMILKLFYTNLRIDFWKLY